MPKEREHLKQFVFRMIKQFPGVFRADQSVLFCKKCNCSVKATKLFSVKQHLETAKHKMAAEKKIVCSKTLLTEQNKINNPFAAELCEVFIKANIPLKKFTHPSLKLFLEKYIDCPIPCEATLRQQALPFLYDQCLQKLRLNAEDQYIWIYIDETTDSEQRLIANFMFGVLHPSSDSAERGKSYLFNVTEVQAANAHTMATFINDSLAMLWPKGVKYSKVLLIVTDAAAYMLAAVTALKTLYPNMLHLTCFAHGLHRLSEFIRSKYPQVNECISSTKAVFVKAPMRRVKFRNTLPDVPLPPTPCITRWGTWLAATVYYCNNYAGVKSVVDDLDSDDAECIQSAQNIFSSSTLVSELIYIKSNFGCISEGIIKLQAQGLSLKESIDIVEGIREKLQQLNDKTFFEKFKKILSRNKDYEKIRDISNVLHKGCHAQLDFTKQLLPAALECFAFCPTTSSDVERSFSTYGNILTEKRKSFLVENLKKHLVVCFNQNI